MLKRNIKRIFLNRCSSKNDSIYLFKGNKNENKQFESLYHFFFSKVKDAWNFNQNL